MNNGIGRKLLEDYNYHFIACIGGNYHVRVWQIDFNLPKLHPMDVKLAAVRRVILCMDLTTDDKIAYCGTSTGDILKISIDRNEIQSYNDPDTTVPALLACSKDKFAKGVKVLMCVLNVATGNNNVMVGAGDGTLNFMNPQMHVVAGYKTQLMGGVTSISRQPNGDKLIVGTDQCNRYEVSLDLAHAELKASCHYGMYVRSGALLVFCYFFISYLFFFMSLILCFLLLIVYKIRLSVVALSY